MKLRYKSMPLALISLSFIFLINANSQPVDRQLDEIDGVLYDLATNKPNN